MISRPLRGCGTGSDPLQCSVKHLPCRAALDVFAEYEADFVTTTSIHKDYSEIREVPTQGVIALPLRPETRGDMNLRRG